MLYIQPAESTQVKGYSLGTVLSPLKAIKLDLNDGISPAEEEYRLNYYDLYPTINSDGENILDQSDQGFKDDYDYIGTLSSPLPAGTNLVESTKFYRSINVEYRNIQAAAPWNLTACATVNCDVMLVTSTVQWKDGNVTHQMLLSSALSRYKK
jgi:hypothetical protein